MNPADRLLMAVNIASAVAASVTELNPAPANGGPIRADQATPTDEGLVMEPNPTQPMGDQATPANKEPVMVPNPDLVDTTLCAARTMPKPLSPTKEQLAVADTILTNMPLRQCAEIAIQKACMNGNIDSVQPLIEIFGLTVMDQKRAFQCACAQGHLIKAQLLTNKFGLTPESASASGNSAFRRACANGHLDVAQWLTDKFGSTPKSVRANENYAFRRACANGHLKVAQWLTDNFNLTAEDARACYNYALRVACERGHIVIVRWMSARFGLTSEDARACQKHALPLACKQGYYQMTLFLVELLSSTVTSAPDKEPCASEVSAS